MATRDKIICATVFFVCLFASWAGLVFAGKASADAFVAFLSTTLAGGCAAFLALLKPDAKLAGLETTSVSPSTPASASPAVVEPVFASSSALAQAPDAPAAPSQPSAASGATSAAVLKPTLTAATEEDANA